MRIHDITLITDLSRQDPNHPDDPPLGGDPEEGMEYDKAIRRRTEKQSQKAMI